MPLLESTRKLFSDRPQPQKPKQLQPVMKKSWNYYSEQTTYINSAEGMRNLYLLACQRNLSHIGFDTEFGFSRPGVFIDARKTVENPFDVRPLLLSLAVAEIVPDGSWQYADFVIDLRVTELQDELQRLLNLPLVFCGHYLVAELICLWKLGLCEPQMIWDTWTAEKLLSLGQGYYRPKKEGNLANEIRAKENAQALQQYSLSLLATCMRYGVTHGMAEHKKELQLSFLSHPDGTDFSAEQIGYAAEDAVTACQLYPLQVQKITENNLLNHCLTVEMPWTVTTAKMRWNGVRVDRTAAEKTHHQITKQLNKLAPFITARFGIKNYRSSNDLQAYFQKQGLLHHFKAGDGYCFDKEMLKLHEHRDPAIPFLQAAIRGSKILSDRIFNPEFEGEDGRVRPDYRQLGATTGRQTSQFPNMLGLDKRLWPIIISEPGFGIFEVDWSQVEVGVAAAVYGDRILIEMYNSGDVYSAMAKIFFKGQLTADDLEMPSHLFKEKHKGLRTQMKACTLGIIFGMTPIGLAADLRIPVAEAARLLAQFMGMFPELREALHLAAEFGGLRGYAVAVSGMRRYRTYRGRVSSKERNWMKNYPVQASAGVVFKAAGNRLHRLYQGYDAKIIIPLHDAFIVEAPLETLKEVAELTAQVMCRTLQEFFPALRPKTTINMSQPQCWNKDGEVDGLTL